MNNLSAARDAIDMTQQQVADYIGIDRVSIARYESGQRSPSKKTWARLSALYKVSVDYLMGITDDPNPTSTPTVTIPVLGTVAAGIPIDAIEEIVDWEEIPETMARGGEYFGLRVKGRSMEPRIMEGDTVIVRRQESVESGEIAIILVNGDEGTCKKVQKHENGGISLVAFNAAVYQPRFYTPDEIRDLPVAIIGKVVELRGKF